MHDALHVERSTPAARGGAPVVMLHGWGMNLRVFDALRADLAEFESWAIDLPGYGRSPWWPEAASFDAQCNAVRAALPPRCVLVGWSFGAKIAIALAAAEPHRVAALVLLSATPRFVQATDWPQGTEPGAARAFQVLLEQDWRRTLSDFVWLQVRGSREAQATGRELEAALSAQGAPRSEALHAGLDLLDSVDLRDLVPHVHQPVLLVSGQNDRVTLPAAAQWLAEHLPAARLHEIARAGHAPFVSHHAEVAALMRAFLDELPGVARSHASVHDA